MWEATSGTDLVFRSPITIVLSRDSFTLSTIQSPIPADVFVYKLFLPFRASFMFTYTEIMFMLPTTHFSDALTAPLVLSVSNRLTDATCICDSLPVAIAIAAVTFSSVPD
eukprot:gene19690-6859_t